MLFDIRGRRKNVVRVVYAILALLMGASLFLVVGPFNLGSLVGNGTTAEASKIFNEQAEKAEAKLRKEPDNPDLLLAVATRRVAAGNAEVETDPSTGARVVSPEARLNYDKAAVAWNRYLKQSETVNPSVALTMATAFFTVAEGGTQLEEIVASLDDAAKAQRIAAEGRPTVGLLTTLAIYEFFAGNFAAAEKAGDEAVAKATGQEKKQVEEQVAEFRKRGKQWAKQKKEAAKAEKEQGKESLQNPFGGLGG